MEAGHPTLLFLSWFTSSVYNHNQRSSLWAGEGPKGQGCPELGAEMAGVGGFLKQHVAIRAQNWTEAGVRVGRAEREEGSGLGRGQE